MRTRILISIISHNYYYFRWIGPKKNLLRDAIFYWPFFSRKMKTQRSFSWWSIFVAPQVRCLLDQKVNELQRHHGNKSVALKTTGKNSRFFPTKLWALKHTDTLCMIFMILVSLENVKKYSHVVAWLPQRLKSTLFEIFSNRGFPLILAFRANSAIALSRENLTKIVKITHSASVAR